MSKPRKKQLPLKERADALRRYLRCITQCTSIVALLALAVDYEERDIHCLVSLGHDIAQ